MYDEFGNYIALEDSQGGTGNVYQDDAGNWVTDPSTDNFEFGNTLFSGTGQSLGTLNFGAPSTTGATANPFAQIGQAIAQVFGVGQQPVVTGVAQPSVLSSAPLGIPLIIWIALIAVVAIESGKK